MTRKIDNIVIHEADCALMKPSGSEFTIKDIDQWHIERGFKRTQQPYCSTFHPELIACGYNYVIGVTGTRWPGRHEDEIPAAVQGHNSHSINICLIGKGKYTSAQWDELAKLVAEIQSRNPDAAIRGHREFDTAIAQGKTCPDFDVQEWVAGGMVALDDHTEEA